MALEPNQKKEFRQQIMRLALVAEKYSPKWHYTQARPYTGLGVPMAYTHHNDCSSYAGLLFYSANHAAGVAVSDPLGWHFSGIGNTQTCYQYLKAHQAPADKYRVGDIALYGSTWRTVHLTICRKAGTGDTAVWTSFGREAGPEARIGVHYHPSPLVGVYRHPALL